MRYKPGDSVKLTVDYSDPLRDIPAGTGGVVLWMDNTRGTGAVAFVGVGEVRNFPAAWLVSARATWRRTA
jgi:hypothetical protein